MKPEPKIIYSLDIIIEANREDEEPWRLNRMQRVMGYAQPLAALQDQEEFYKKSRFQQAWNSSVTLHEGNIIDHRMENT